MPCRCASGRERVNTIRNKRPERPQHILNYSRIDGHAFLPKNKPNLGEVTIFFSGSDRTPPTLCSASPTRHPLGYALK